MKTELTWEKNRTELDRQVKWQTVRNEFYSNLQYEAKNSAAHERANTNRGFSAGQGPSIDRAVSRQEDRQAECLTSHEFYYRVVCPHDAKLKQAQRDGNAETHRALLDEANVIIREMLNHTILALSHHTI